jgi:hypothetical protein
MNRIIVGQDARVASWMFEVSNSRPLQFNMAIGLEEAEGLVGGIMFTGWNGSDIEVLLGALSDLVERGNTVLVIEHDLDVVRMGDHVIDLGPEGGDGGGRVVVAGTPDEVAAFAGSHTGRYLAAALRGSLNHVGGRGRGPRSRRD